MDENLNETRSLIRDLIEDLFNNDNNVAPQLFFFADVGFKRDAHGMLMLPLLARVGQMFDIGNEDVQVVSQVDNVCVFAKISSNPLVSLTNNSGLLAYFAAPVVSLLHLEDPTKLSHVCFLEPNTYVDLHDGTITLASNSSNNDVCQ